MLYLHEKDTNGADLVIVSHIPQLSILRLKNHRKHFQRKAKKSESREAYIRKASYARIEASYGSRYSIAHPDQTKLDSAIDAILATHFPKNDECQPDASSSYMLDVDEAPLRLMLNMKKILNLSFIITQMPLSPKIYAKPLKAPTEFTG